MHYIKLNSKILLVTCWNISLFQRKSLQFEYINPITDIIEFNDSNYYSKSENKLIYLYQEIYLNDLVFIGK